MKKITKAKIREAIWAWFGWAFTELSWFLDHPTGDPDKGHWAWRWLGGSLWYSLGRYCYDRAYWPGEKPDVVWPWSKEP